MSALLIDFAFRVALHLNKVIPAFALRTGVTRICRQGLLARAKISKVNKDLKDNHEL